MKNKTFAILQISVPRIIFLGMLLFTFTAVNSSVVYAHAGATQISAPEAAATTVKDGTLKLTKMVDDDCEDDDERGAQNSIESESGDCPAPVRVAAVWTADEDLDPKTSFVFGQRIRWVITVKNTTKHSASVTLTYVIKDPQGTVIRNSELNVLARPGESVWSKSGVVPSTAGTYSFAGSVKYRDFTTRRTVKYHVSSPCHSLTTSSNPDAGGAVGASPAPDCNSGTQYTNGTVVTLTANANLGYAFSSWSGAVSGEANPITVTMTANKSVVANFVEFTGLTAGIYDDTNLAWSYTGDWSTATNAGYYNGILHSSPTVGNSAVVSMYGSKFTLYYTADAGYGDLDVYVDDVKTGTINEFSATTMLQATWTSPVLTNDIHTLKFVHLNGVAVNIDAIQVYALPDSVAPGPIGDLAAASGTTTGTVDLSWTAPGDDNDMGTTASYLVRYSTSAITDETAWNAATPVAVGIPTPSPAGSAQNMTVTGLTPGTTYFFAVRAQDEESNIGEISNSPSAIAKQPAPVGPGMYDDADAAWVYMDVWTAYTNSGPMNNTLHYTNVQNASASVTFTGTQFTLYFTQYPNRGEVEVWIDGIKRYTFNENGSSLAWQQSWTLPLPLSDGVHTVEFKNPSADPATYIDIDLIQIMGPVEPVGPGTYDDADTAWIYEGAWTNYTNSGPMNNTLHYTNAQNASASVTFTGTHFTLYFTQYPNRGVVEVWIDGIKRYTFNQNGSWAWQQSWALPVPLSNGVHTVQFRNPSADTSVYIDIDAITIAGPVGAGSYDDADAAWGYAGAWTNYTNSGPMNNTLHYTNAQNASAIISFTGTQFTIYFTQYPNRGSVEVWIDGGQQYTFNENGSSLAWQQSWTLPLPLSDGVHTVEFKNPSADPATYIDIDAIQIE